MIRWAALCALLAQPVFAQTEAAVGMRAAERLAQAERAINVARLADNPVVALTSVVQAFEDGLIPARAGLLEANIAYVSAKQALDQRGPALEGLLTTLMAAPPVGSAKGLHPAGAVASVRSAVLRKDLAPALDTEIVALRDDLHAVARASAARDAAMTVWREGQMGMSVAQGALARAMQDRPPLPQRFVADPVQTALVSANAGSFGAVTAALTALYGVGLPNDAMLAAKGALPQPVTGRVLHRFGTQTEAGQTRNGITFATPPGALVVSPTAATILYQGPLLTFDEVVILEPTAGVMLIFAGLAETYGIPGQIIPAGTPLGAMGGEAIPGDMNLTSFPVTESGAASQALYLEVREGQTLLDPATWFALEQQVEEK